MKVLTLLASVFLIFGIVMTILYFRKKTSPLPNDPNSCNQAIAFYNSVNALAANGLGNYARTGPGGGPNILDMNKINATNSIETPLYLPNGFKLWMDPDIPTSRIEPTDIYLQWDKFTIRLAEISIDSKNNWIGKSYTDLELGTPFREGASHFANLMDGYLAKHSRNDSLIWNEVNAMFILLNSLPIYDSSGPLPGEITIPLVWPNIDQIYAWLKQEISNIGGISGIIKKFETRIKYDMIQSMINNDKTDGQRYRSIVTGPETGSGHCTAHPLSWWQNCPAGKIPTGWRGWTSDGACHKWYQHISGELMCSPYNQNSAIRLGGFCDTVTSSKTEDMIDFASQSIGRILAELGLIPALAGVIVIVVRIFKKLGNFEWIFEDMKDVCYNYRCASDVNDQEYSCGDTTGKTKCCPGVSDSVLAHRSCPGQNCNNVPAGTCKPVNSPCSIDNSDVDLSIFDKATERDLYRVRDV